MIKNIPNGTDNNNTITAITEIKLIINSLLLVNGFRN